MNSITTKPQGTGDGTLAAGITSVPSVGGKRRSVYARLRTENAQLLAFQTDANALFRELRHVLAEVIPLLRSQYGVTSAPGSAKDELARALGCERHGGLSIVPGPCKGKS